MQRTSTLILVLFVLKSYSIGFMSSDSTRFSVAGGMSFSTDNIRRDMANVPHPGLDLRFQVFLTNCIRLSAEYTHNTQHDLGIIWRDVRSNLYELDFHYIASIKDNKSEFYTIAGIAAQKWTGIYTGMGHEYEFRQYGSPQSYYSTTWPSLSIGCGMQRTVKKFELYGEFKYRVSKRSDNVPISIMDVNYSLGVRYHIKPSFDKNGRRKPLIRMPGDRYHWF